MMLSRRHVHPRRILALDVGQTGSRFAYGSLRGDAPALVAGSEFAETCAAIVEAVVATLPESAVDVVAVGATGLNGRTPPASELRQRLVGVVGPVEAIVADDSVTAYLGALGDVAGAVVAAGTGAVVLASDGRTTSARVDGAGYLIGDAGSGFWIGRRGLQAAVRARDGRGPATVLVAAAEEWFGALGELPQRLAADPDRVRAIASFAPKVAAAAGTGDEPAREIVEAAGVELATSVAAALERCGLATEAVPVAIVGAVAGAGEPLLAAFDRELALRCPSALRRPSSGSPLDGALLLASASLRAFAALVASAAVDSADQRLIGS